MTSLSDIIGAASNALRVAQAQINVVSDNIGNAQSPNYSKRTSVIEDLVQGAGGGAKIVSIQRAVAPALQADQLVQTADSSGASALSALYTSLEQLTGSSTGTPLLSSAMSKLQSAWQAFQASPENNSAEQAVVTAGKALVDTVQTIASGVEQLAQQTTTSLGTDVTALNTQLTTIGQLNTKIAVAKAGGQSVPALEDQRDQAIAAVAALVPVKTVTRADGKVALFTPDGVALIDEQPNQFTYDPTANTVAASDSPTVSLNQSFEQSGKIGAELNILRTDAAAVTGSNPALAPLEKVRQQLNSFVDQFYAAPPATPTPFQAAYDAATPVNPASGSRPAELAASFFTIAATTPPAVAGSQDRFNFALNAALVNGTASVKQSAATAVVADVTNSTRTLTTAGLSVGPTTYAGLADGIANDQSVRASQAKDEATTATATLAATTTRLKSDTGVNMDEELAQLVVLQNSYAASARVIATVQQMSTTLLGMFA
jgi:flagellar hook-associated protein 1